MTCGLKGRNAIVTESTSGIGSAIAKGLARAGAAAVIDGRGKHIRQGHIAAACLYISNEGSMA